MASLLGKALQAAAGPPVPMGSAMPSRLPGMTLGSNTEQALLRTYKTNGTVQSNVSLLASSVAATEWRLYRKQQADGRVRYTTSDRGTDDRVEVLQHAALNVLNNPALISVQGVRLPVWTRFALFEISGIWMEQVGKSFWVVDHPDGSTLPLGLWPVRPDRMTPVPDRDKFLKGWIYTSPDGMEKIPFLPTEVIWNRYPDPEDLYGGCGPIQSVLTDIEAARSAAEWNRNYFINSAEPGGVIQVDHELRDEEFDELVNRWRETHRGVARAHRIAVLEAGQTWVQNAHSIRDMDFAALRSVSRDIIREALGMHKVMTGVTDDVNRANAQTGEEVFGSWKVDPRLGRWRDVINHQLLPLFGKTGEGVEFDYLLPTPRNREADALELQAKSNAALALVTAGYDQHDVLRAVGLNDMGVALQLSTQPALPPRWTLGEPPQPAAAPKTPATLPAVGEPGGGVPAAALRAAAGWDSPAWDALDVPTRRLPLPAGAGPAVWAKDAGAKVFEQQAQDYPPAAMAWMHHADWKGPVSVPLDHIRPQLKWMDGADPDHVADFAKKLRKGRKVKPVLLVKTPSSQQLLLVDGHHRYLAYAELDEPVRGYIGTVDTDHGDWEQMHDFQLDHGAERGAKAGQRVREQAIWNSLAGVR